MGVASFRWLYHLLPTSRAILSGQGQGKDQRCLGPSEVPAGSPRPREGLPSAESDLALADPHLRQAYVAYGAVKRIKDAPRMVLAGEKFVECHLASVVIPLYIALSPGWIVGISAHFLLLKSEQLMLFAGHARFLQAAMAVAWPVAWPSPG
jgi:hypothetical protein